MQIASAPEHTPEHTSPESLWDTLAHFIAGAIAMFGDVRALAERVLLSRKEHRIASAWLSRCEDLLRRLIFIDAVKLLARPLTLTHSETPKLCHSGAAKPSPEPRSDSGAGCPWVPDRAPRVRNDGVCTLIESQNFGPLVSVETPARGAKDAPCCDPANPAAWRAPFALIPRSGGSRGGRGGLYKSEPREPGEFIDPDESRERALVLAEQQRLLFAPTPAPDKNSASANPEQRQAITALVPSHTLALRLEALLRAGQYPARHAERLARWLARDRARAALFTRPTRSFYSLRRPPADHAVADATHFARAAWADCDSS